MKPALNKTNPRLIAMVGKYLWRRVLPILLCSCAAVPERLMPTLYVGSAGDVCLGLFMERKQPLGGFILCGNEIVMVITSISGPDAAGQYRWEAEMPGAPNMWGSLAMNWNDLGYLPWCNVKCDNWEGYSELFQGGAWPVASGWSLNLRSPEDIR